MATYRMQRLFAQVFLQKAGSVRKALKAKAELIFVTAPHAISLLETREDATFFKAANAGDNPHGWWTWKEEASGTRPSTAAAYQGVETSLASLEDIWQQQAPFDGIIGFSQGATMAVLFVAHLAKMQPAQLPQFCILAAGFLPRDPAWANTVGSLASLPLQSLVVHAAGDRKRSVCRDTKGMSSPSTEPSEEPASTENVASKLTASAGVWGSLKQTIFGMGSRSEEHSDSDTEGKSAALADDRPAGVGTEPKNVSVTNGHPDTGAELSVAGKDSNEPSPRSDAGSRSHLVPAAEPFVSKASAADSASSTTPERKSGSAGTQTATSTAFANVQPRRRRSLEERTSPVRTIASGAPGGVAPTPDIVDGLMSQVVTEGLEAPSGPTPFQPHGSSLSESLSMSELSEPRAPSMSLAQERAVLLRGEVSRSQELTSSTASGKDFASSPSALEAAAATEDAGQDLRDGRSKAARHMKLPSEKATLLQGERPGDFYVQMPEGHEISIPKDQLRRSDSDHESAAESVDSMRAQQSEPLTITTPPEAAGLRGGNVGAADVPPAPKEMPPERTAAALSAADAALGGRAARLPPVTDAAASAPFGAAGSPAAGIPTRTVGDSGSLDDPQLPQGAGPVPVGAYAPDMAVLQSGQAGSPEGVPAGATSSTRSFPVQSSHPITLSPEGTPSPERPGRSEWNTPGPSGTPPPLCCTGRNVSSARPDTATQNEPDQAVNTPATQPAVSQPAAEPKPVSPSTPPDAPSGTLPPVDAASFAHRHNAEDGDESFRGGDAAFPLSAVRRTTVQTAAAPALEPPEHLGGQVVRKSLDEETRPVIGDSATEELTPAVAPRQSLRSTGSGLPPPLTRTSSAGLSRGASGELPAPGQLAVSHSPPQPKTAGKHDSGTQSPYVREGDPFAQHSPAIDALEKAERQLHSEQQGGELRPATAPSPTAAASAAKDSPAPAPEPLPAGLIPDLPTEPSLEEPLPPPPPTAGKHSFVCKAARWARQQRVQQRPFQLPEMRHSVQRP
ncbi:hypothetical protein WJX73_006695 [Symbiochloris irregularis]|uniref:Serine hydrolase domain-containing protein n=1 Tax=Symbiochloris irregularis TaxID=706552 RepID=A0AAW1NVL8_9CHLO